MALDYLATKHGMADTLKALRHGDEQLSTRTRAQLTDVVEEFCLAGTRQAVIRRDVPANDILTALAGVTLASGESRQREQAGRLLDPLLDGITRPDGWRERVESSAP